MAMLVYQDADGNWRETETGDAVSRYKRALEAISSVRLDCQVGVDLSAPTFKGWGKVAQLREIARSALTGKTADEELAEYLARNTPDVLAALPVNSFVRADGMICNWNPVTGQSEPTGRKWCADACDTPAIVRRKEAGR